MLFSSSTSDLPEREEFRTIRTNLYQFREKRGLKIVEIASTLSGEGKSFIAANIAHALALPRKEKVLLIDCDLRRGSAAGLLGAKPGPGIAEYLQGAASLKDVLQHGTGGSLYLIPSGLRMHDPGELIGSFKLEELFSQLRGIFDWIVVDTPPALQFIDADVIADLCDGIVLVIGAGMTPMQLGKRAARELKKHVVLGAVLNRAQGAGSASKYFSYYGDAKLKRMTPEPRDE